MATASFSGSLFDVAQGISGGIGACVMTATALGHSSPGGTPEPCGLCGATEPGKPWRSVLKSSFTNLDEVRAPSICWACEACLNDRQTRSAFLVHCGSFQRIARKEMWPMLFNPPAPPFVLYLTMSGKKHGLFRQRIAESCDVFRIQCEAMGCNFSPCDNAEWMRACAQLVLSGVNRNSVESGTYSSTDYKAAGIQFLRDRESLIAPVRTSTVFAIVYGLMPGKEDLKGADYVG